MANLLEQCDCKLKDEALDKLNIALVGTARKTGSMYGEGLPVKCSHASSVASDIATEEEIAMAVPGTSASPHSLTSAWVCLTTSSLNQYDTSVIPMRPSAREDPNHIGLPEEQIPIHTNINGKSVYP